MTPVGRRLDGNKVFRQSFSTFTDITIGYLYNIASTTTQHSQVGCLHAGMLEPCCSPTDISCGSGNCLKNFGLNMQQSSLLVTMSFEDLLLHGFQENANTKWNLAAQSNMGYGMKCAQL